MSLNFGQRRLLPQFILASGSPRRRHLLESVGLTFEAVESGVDESQREDEQPEQYALRMACEKARTVSLRNPTVLVLGADTVVDLDGEVLGKPTSAAEAKSTLLRLSGRTHRVITAIALAKDGTILEHETVCSWVTFRRLSPEEIDAYILSREPFDKAGAYGVQGLGRNFVEEISGSFTNVMGLPLENVLPALKRNLL